MPRVVLSNEYDANSNRTPACSRSLAATIAGLADFQNVYTYDALDRLTQLYQQSQTGGNAVAVKGANLTYNLLGQLATVARTNFFCTGADARYRHRHVLHMMAPRTNPQV